MNLIKQTKTNHLQQKRKQKKRTKKNPQICSPFNESVKKNKSCFDKNTLIKLIKAWNQTHADNKIKYKTKESHNYLWEKLGAKMSDRCDNEYCWTKELFVKKINTADTIKENFLPEKPKEWEANPREWLDTNNIFDVMVQYEVKYPDYRFFGPVPIDFDLKSEFNTCVVSELCKVNLKLLHRDGIRKLGVISVSYTHLTLPTICSV